MAVEPEVLLASLGGGLDTAVGKGDLPNPGANQSLAASNGADSEAYIKAVRARLVELGYLGKSAKNRHSTEANALFKQAVKRFQQDVALPVVDGWVGPKTWQVMQCLLSFEEEQEAEQWHLLCTLENSPAVARAVYLRLYVMGFFEDWKDDALNTRRDISLDTNPRFLAAYHRFIDFLVEAGLYEGVKPDAFDISVIQCLFNYDTLTKAIAAKPVLFNHYPQTMQAVARIELWLQGYDVMPGADQTYKRKKTGGSPAGNRNRWITVSKTEEAVEQFWKDNPDFNEDDDTVTPALFQAFSDLLDAEADDEDIDDEVTRKVELLMHDEDQKNTVLEQFKQLANGIWDGFKRLTKWLSRMFRRAVGAVKNLSFNLVRFIARKARYFFADVVKAIEIVSNSLHYLKGDLFTADNDRAVLSHDKDFDHVMVLDYRLDTHHLKTMMSEYRYQTRCYAAGSRIVAHLVAMFKTVVQIAATAWAWLQALLALMKLSRNIKAIRNEVNAMRDYEMRINHPNAVFTHAVT